jgi:hypothetical protein
MITQDRIALRAIKHSGFASQETHCYQGNIYFDGKLVANVYNDGHGGCDGYTIKDQARWDDMQNYINTLPCIDLDTSGNSCRQLMPDIEIICCDLVNAWLARRDLSRLIKKRVVFTKKDQPTAVWQTGVIKTPAGLARALDHIKADDTTDVIFNMLPFEEALAKYVSLTA